MFIKLFRKIPERQEIIEFVDMPASYNRNDVFIKNSYPQMKEDKCRFLSLRLFFRLAVKFLAEFKFMKVGRLNIFLLVLFIFAVQIGHLYGQQVLSPKQIQDPAYAQLDFMNRLSEWNIRQMGFQIVGGAFRNSGKRLSQAEINRIIENAKKLNRYNGAPTVTHFKNSGQPIIPSIIARDAEFRNFDNLMTANLMNKSLMYYLKTSAEDNFEPNDLTWAMVYFLDINYLVYHDANRPGRSSTNLTGVSPQISFKIYQQIHKTLADDPGIQKMSDREKQIATENLAIMTGTASFQYGTLIDPSSLSNLANGLYGKPETPQEKEAKITAVKRQAGQNLEKIFGVPANRIKINENGVSFD